MEEGKNATFKTVYDYIDDYFSRRRLKIYPAFTNSGKYLWHGDFVRMFVDRNNQTRVGARCRKIFN